MPSFLQPTGGPTSAQDNLLALLNSRSISTKQAMIEMQKLGIKGLWKHATLKPQDVCDAFGTGAAARFQFHGILTEALIEMQAAERALQAPGEPPISYGLLWPAKTWTVNPDGTVTIGETDFTPPA